MSAFRDSIRYVIAMAIATSALSVMGATPALADVGLGVHFGYAKARDADSGDGLVGGHLEIRPVRVLGIQAAIDYRSVSQYDVVVGPVDGSLDVRSVPVTLAGRLYLPVGLTSSLFAGAGAGWYHLIYDYSNDLEDIGLGDDALDQARDFDYDSTYFAGGLTVHF